MSGAIICLVLMNIVSFAMSIYCWWQWGEAIKTADRAMELYRKSEELLKRSAKLFD